MAYKPIKIYVAGSWSTPQEKESLMGLIAELKARSEANPGVYSLYIPMEFTVEGDFQKADGTWNLPNYEWAHQVYQKDRHELEACDMVIAMYTGHRGSTGTPWELGFCTGIHKPFYLYIPEWAKDNDMSLMILNSATGFYQDQQCHACLDLAKLGQFNQK